jgi:hypothetical protein
LEAFAAEFVLFNAFDTGSIVGEDGLVQQIEGQEVGIEDEEAHSASGSSSS